MADEDSPFDDFDDDARDREGDPFDRLNGSETDEFGADESDNDDPDGDDPDSHDPNGETSVDEEADGDSTASGSADAPSAGAGPLGTGGERESGERDSTEPDPFEYLGSPDSGESPREEREGPEDDGVRGADLGPDPIVNPPADGSSGADGEPGAAPGVDVAGDPLGGVDVSRGDPFDSADNPFERVDVDGVDPDEVWERFTADAASGADGTDDDGGPERDEDDVVDVSKHRFCETCPHFSDPPETACGHPGTDVLEFVGTDQVRVANCPVVRERRELGEVHE